MTGQTMTETASILGETVDRLLGQALAGNKTDKPWDPDLWTRLEEQGVIGALAATIDEDQGDPDRLGADGALNMLFLAGRHAAPLPIAEGMLAHWLAAKANVELPGGPVALAGAGWHDAIAIASDGTVTGRAHQVPFARHASTMLAMGEDTMALVPLDAVGIEERDSTAGEPRDSVTFDSAATLAVPSPVGPTMLRSTMAALRAVQIAGALDRILDLTAGYVQERQQFGRPIAKFQAVQQALAELGGQTATTRAAVAMVGRTFGDEDGIGTFAAAKIRASEAVGHASQIAHQAHGAIGFTQEYELQRLTRRLWSWREDYGNESNWARWLGLALTERASDNEQVELWTQLTDGLRLANRAFD